MAKDGQWIFRLKRNISAEVDNRPAFAEYKAKRILIWRIAVDHLQNVIVSFPCASAGHPLIKTCVGRYFPRGLFLRKSKAVRPTACADGKRAGIFALTKRHNGRIPKMELKLSKAGKISGKFPLYIGKPEQRHIFGVQCTIRRTKSQFSKLFFQ